MRRFLGKFAILGGPKICGGNAEMSNLCAAYLKLPHIYGEIAYVEKTEAYVAAAAHLKIS